jgi:hypothetical protein
MAMMRFVQDDGVPLLVAQRSNTIAPFASGTAHYVPIAYIGACGENIATEFYPTPRQSIEVGTVTDHKAVVGMERISNKAATRRLRPYGESSSEAVRVEKFVRPLRDEPGWHKDKDVRPPPAQVDLLPALTALGTTMPTVSVPLGEQQRDRRESFPGLPESDTVGKQAAELFRFIVASLIIEK